MEPNFLCLSAHEVGASITAIEDVARSGKPVAEVGNVRLQPDKHHLLEEDLRQCIELAGEQNVKSFIMATPDKGRWSYGFYRELWVLEALQFLCGEGLDLPGFHRDWISGLLFGYTAGAIQEFLQTRFSEQEPTLLHIDASDREGTAPLYSELSDSHSILKPDKFQRPD